MHAFVLVQLTHLGQQIVLAGIGGKRAVHRLEAQRFGGLALFLHIDFGRGIIAHQHGGETRHQSMLRFQPRRLGGDLFAKTRGRCFAVNDDAGHETQKPKRLDAQNRLYWRNQMTTSTTRGERSSPPMGGTTLRTRRNTGSVRASRPRSKLRTKLLYVLITLKAISQLTITAMITTHQ